MTPEQAAANLGTSGGDLVACQASCLKLLSKLFPSTAEALTTARTSGASIVVNADGTLTVSRANPNGPASAASTAPASQPAAAASASTQPAASPASPATVPAPASPAQAAPDAATQATQAAQPASTAAAGAAQGTPGTAQATIINPGAPNAQAATPAS
jgi:DNA polymerase-3 subunit gamma/tau